MQGRVWQSHPRTVYDYNGYAFSYLCIYRVGSWQYEVAEPSSFALWLHCGLGQRVTEGTDMLVASYALHPKSFQFQHILM